MAPTKVMNSPIDTLSKRGDLTLDELEVRRRRALYRAQHRGTKEMDWLLGRFAEKHLVQMDELQIGVFEQFLAISDPELQPWLMDTPSQKPAPSPDPAFAALVNAIRSFHGLSALPSS